MDKRTFLKSVFLGGTGLFLSAHISTIKAIGTKKKWDGKFILPELSFAYGALEPYIDSRTMELHYTRHFASYTKQFNTAVREAGLTGKTAYEILSGASKYPEILRNTGGAYLNHKLFCKMLAPAKSQRPSPELMKSIVRDFGSFDSFREDFTRAALSIPSEGWAWLIYSDDRLKITHTCNNNNPIMDTASEKGTPLLCLDVWEHAYFNKYQGQRIAYIDSFWHVVNWDFVSLRYSRNKNRKPASA